MLEIIRDYAEWLLGLNIEKLNAGHMIARALIVYIMGIMLLRIDKRFIAERTAFDTIVRFLTAAALANAVTGGSPFFPTLIMVLFIIFTQWLFAYLSFYDNKIEKLLKGSSTTLYKNNAFQWKAMKQNLITKDDILEAIRKNSGLTTPSDVQEVIYENSGEMSIIPHQRANTNFTRRHIKTFED